MELEALFNAVIVKPIEAEENTYGSIIVPDLGKEKNETGEIISVGPGQSTQMGNFIPTTLKVGDIVVLPTMGFTKLPHNGEEYYVGPENQILAKINIPVEDVLAQTEVSNEELKHLTNISNE
jgi:chaperonin GroES